MKLNAKFSECDGIKYFNINLSDFEDIRLKAKNGNVTFIDRWDWVYLDKYNLKFDVKFKRNLLKITDNSYWNLDDLF